MRIKIGLLFCLFTASFSLWAQVKLEVSVGVLTSVDTYKSSIVTSEKQPWIEVEEASQKPFSHPGIRGRFTVSAPFGSRLRALVQTGANLRFAEYLWGYEHTYATVPLQGGLSYTLMKHALRELSLRAYSGLNIFSIHNPLAKQQTGSLHNAELSYCFCGGNRRKSYVVKGGVELETDHQTFYYKADQTFLQDENFYYKVRRHQVYLSVGLIL